LLWEAAFAPCPHPLVTTVRHSLVGGQSLPASVYTSADLCWRGAAEAAASAAGGAPPATAALLRDIGTPIKQWQTPSVWAIAAAASDLPPLPGLGGLPAVALQAAMVRAIARRFGVTADGTVWASLFTLLGGSFLLRHGIGWMLRQALKLAPVWGSFAAAGWSFAVTFGIGEAAIHLCREEALGRKATPAALREAFRQGHQEGAALHGAGRGSASY
jgi:uncharacterized protein (DUF697 family)